jgi:hypothetical protein
MQTTKLLLLTSALLILASPALAETRGWGAGLAVFDEEFGIQARKDFWLGGDISQITAQGGVLFASDAVFFLDADYHFLIKSDSGTSRFYPLAGLDFKFNGDNSEFGINLGGGVNFMLTEKVAAFAEVKYVISDWDGLGLGVGVYF